MYVFINKYTHVSICCLIVTVYSKVSSALGNKVERATIKVVLIFQFLKCNIGSKQCSGWFSFLLKSVHFSWLPLFSLSETLSNYFSSGRC